MGHQVILTFPAVFLDSLNVTCHMMGVVSVQSKYLTNPVMRSHVFANCNLNILFSGLNFTKRLLWTNIVASVSRSDKGQNPQTPAFVAMPKNPQPKRSNCPAHQSIGISRFFSIFGFNSLLTHMYFVSQQKVFYK